MKEQIILQNKIEKGDFARGGETSSRLKELLRKLGIESVINRRITIVTYELEMNIIIHSHGGEITAYISSQEIRIIAEDRGPGIEDLEKAFQPGYSTADDAIRDMGFGAGMGLNNVEHYSDDLEVETGLDTGTRIIARVNLSK